MTDSPAANLTCSLCGASFGPTEYHSCPTATAARFIRPQTADEIAAALSALDRLYDQARNTAGTDEGRKRCYDDLCAISRSIPDPHDAEARYDGTYDPAARYG